LVFWIHASNVARFKQSCEETAGRAKLPGPQDPKANIFKLLADWLNDAKTGNWVLVLDNLDEDEFLDTIPPVEQDGLRDDQILSVEYVLLRRPLLIRPQSTCHLFLLVAYFSAFMGS
jgi:hypothetical protein